MLKCIIITACVTTLVLSIIILIVLHFAEKEKIRLKLKEEKWREEEQKNLDKINEKHKALYMKPPKN